MAQRFFVLDPSGNRYGPAELPLLDQWVQQGRIAPQTVLQDETTGQTFYAQDFPPLAMTMSQMGGPSMIQNPMTANSPYRVLGTRGPKPGDLQYNLSFVCSLLGFIFGAPFAVAGVILAFWAARKGHPNPGMAIIVSLLCLVIVWLPHLNVGG